MASQSPTQSDAPIICVKDVSKTYSGEIKAVCGIGFDVPQGQILGFLGPNGAGKTTTMRIITGFMPPTAGTVTVDGYDIFNDPILARKQIGYLPEHPPLYPELTPLEYLTFVARIKGLRKKQIPDRIEYVLDKCSLLDVADRLIGHLSKGYRQRVGLAQALIHQPKILVLDEPTVGLDPKQIREIRELIRSLKGSHTILLSTHILPEVSMICDRALIIHRGKIVADDTIANLTGKSGEEQRLFIRLTEPGNDVVGRLSGIDGVLSVDPQQEPGTFSLTIDPAIEPEPNISLEILTQGWGLAEFSHPSSSLEETFVRLTAE